MSSAAHGLDITHSIDALVVRVTVSREEFDGISECPICHGKLDINPYNYAQKYCGGGNHGGYIITARTKEVLGS